MFEDRRIYRKAHEKVLENFESSLALTLSKSKNYHESEGEFNYRRLLLERIKR